MGLYDVEIKNELNIFLGLTPLSMNYKEIKTTYDELKSGLMVELYAPDVIRKLETIRCASSEEKDTLLTLYIAELNKNRLTSASIIDFSNKIASSILFWISTSTHFSIEEALSCVYSTYLVKNQRYGDSWFKHGDLGICRDMGRKMLRLINVENSGDDVTNTFFDIINYCAFLNVYQKYIRN